jgi:class 3 adenylate cyclase
MFVDGDDFVGRALNLASRLCDMAAPGEVLVDGDSSYGLPGWVSVEPYKSVTVKGLGKRRDIQSLRIASGQNVPAWSIT